MLELMENADLERLHFGLDRDTGLQAIVAIQSTSRGSAMGGCRFIKYSSEQDAITDAARLAKGMSYKSAIAGIPHGGGKAVIIMPDQPFDRRALLQAFGRFIDQLGGQYITAMDSGTTMADMDIINRETRWVTCTSQFGDPSPYTALGVFAGIKAAVNHQFGSDNLHDCRINLQGLGNVGYAVAEHLYKAGAKLCVTDLNPHLVEKAAKELDARCVNPDQIYLEPADIFCPCGLGSIINPSTLQKLDVKIIAGSANNQLATPDIGQTLQQSGILYAPDYVINAGGLIFVALKHDQVAQEQIDQQIQNIGATLSTLFQQSVSSGHSPAQLADQRAEHIIQESNLQVEV